MALLAVLMQVFGGDTLRSIKPSARSLRCWFLKKRRPLSLEKAGSGSLCRLPGHPAQERGRPTAFRLRGPLSMNSVRHDPSCLALLVLCLLVDTLCNAQCYSWPWWPSPYFTRFSRPRYIHQPTGFTPETQLSVVLHWSLLILCHSVWLMAGRYLKDGLV